eukprot:CAMPEP_0194054092 /NCGR_PEP_ID=MMETSP0009_2-20130614/52374_1 /TAXON_ID=210454 /ORGANISM="Grammatophora oceanica, Strain CCMP 410" /LENGTH=36 /DNA_ID= /DNA_START= /DNA_END= /DNA_ORIENTATION=
MPLPPASLMAANLNPDTYFKASTNSNSNLLPSVKCR